MASVLYNKVINAVAKGEVVFGLTPLKAMLVTSAYVPDRDAHNFRSSVTDEVAGSGYAAGGEIITATVERDDANDRTLVNFSDVEWALATLTARAAVIYVSRGGAAGADELVAYVDFGADKGAVNESFVFRTTTPLAMINQTA